LTYVTRKTALTAAKVVLPARRSASETSKEDDMNTKLSMVVAVWVALFLSACGVGVSPQSLIVGKWEVAGAKVGGTEVGSPVKMTAEFSRDGTAKITVLGQTLQGAYKLNADNELEWTLNGITTKSKVNVTATELDVTDEANRTIKYKRK
jgi:hypothetical protein